MILAEVNSSIRAQKETKGERNKYGKEFCSVSD